MKSRRAGRPRKQGVKRYADGSIARGQRSETERPEAVTATALEARVRQLLGVDMWLETRRDETALKKARKRVSDPLLGSALGRVLYAEEIDRKQHDAGGYFGWLLKSMAKIQGWPSPNVRAIDYGSNVGGFSVHAEDSDEWVTDVKRKWGDAYRAIYDANGDHGRSTGDIYAILKRTLVEDIGPRNLIELGNLRIGLNAINHARGV